MDTGYYTYLLAHPEKLTSADAGNLELLLQKYPYFQSARALQLKILKNQDSYRYNDALKLAAANTADRDILFEYITSEKFIQNEISQNILQQTHEEYEADLKAIEIESEDISEEIQLEKENQLQSEKDMAQAILDPELFSKKKASIETVEQESEIKNIAENEPLAFTNEDSYSFSEWLKLTAAKPIDRNVKTAIEEEEEEIENDSRNRKFDLIDRFIQEQPKISPMHSPDKDISKAISEQLSAYSQAPDSLMTETLAKVYLQQKNYKKAIQAYKILILKYPEKSGYFADQIRAIEKIINPEQS